MAVFTTKVEQIPGNSSGLMAGGGTRKILLHSTEGSSIEGAVAAFKANNSWPHLTVDCGRRRVAQHLDLQVAARSLRNLSGGVETNRQGDLLVQIEMVGFAANPSTLGSTPDLAWFGADVIAPICKAYNVPARCTVPFRAYPGSYGIAAPQRLSPSAWSTYSGLLGHQHAPENTHGDPGALDVGVVLTAAQAALVPPAPIPSPNPEEMPEMFLYSTPGKPAYFCHNGQAVGLNEATDITTFRSQGVPLFMLDDDTFAKFRERFPGA